MNKVLKNIFVSIIIVLVLWCVFIIFDCLRLRNAKYYTYPIITLKQDVSLERVTYTGLGYTISYIQNKTLNYQNGMSAVGIGACGAEFRLFGKILIWAYIE